VNAKLYVEALLPELAQDCRWATPWEGAMPPPYWKLMPPNKKGTAVEKLANPGESVSS